MDGCEEDVSDNIMNKRYRGMERRYKKEENTYFMD
jgi:hypothetical protein